MSEHLVKMTTAKAHLEDLLCSEQKPIALFYEHKLVARGEPNRKN